MTQTVSMKSTIATPATFTFADGRTVNRMGFGAMRLTGQPGNFGPYEDWDTGIATLRAAQDAGVNFFDTAKAYGPRYSEQLVADALAPYGDMFIATKGGIAKTGVGGDYIKRDGRPQQLRREIEESLGDLKTDVIDLYYLHAPDRTVPFADQIGALPAYHGAAADLGASLGRYPRLFTDTFAHRNSCPNHGLRRHASCQPRICDMALKLNQTQN